MIIKQLIWPMVLVGLPDADVVQTMTISKLDYTIPCSDCQTENDDKTESDYQTEKYKDTMQYNYIKKWELIRKKNIEWSRVLP